MYLCIIFHSLFHPVYFPTLIYIIKTTRICTHAYVFVATKTILEKRADKPTILWDWRVTQSATSACSVNATYSRTHSLKTSIVIEWGIVPFLTMWYCSTFLVSV